MLLDTNTFYKWSIYYNLILLEDTINNKMEKWPLASLKSSTISLMGLFYTATNTGSYGYTNIQSKNTLIGYLFGV